MALGSLFEHISTRDAVLTAALVWTVYHIAKMVYNRFFHPLAHVPGPVLGTMTELYRFYHLFIRSGTFYLLFEELRDKYGPVIRIAPNEVLLADPEHYDKIYSMTSKFTKDPEFYLLVGAPWTVFSTMPNDMHKRKRGVLNPFFSRRSVLAQEDIVQSKVGILCDRLEADSSAPQKTATDLGTGLRAMAVDVLTEYAFGADNCFRSVEREDFGIWFNQLMLGVTPQMYLLRIMPWLQKPMQGMPLWLAKKINPLVTGLLGAIDKARCQIRQVVKEVDAGLIPEKPTIFHTILDPDADYYARGLLPGGDKRWTPPVGHLIDEAFGLTGASSDTTGNIIAICVFFALEKEGIRRRLCDELEAAFPDADGTAGKLLDYQTLEKLPYLTAVVKEGLRRGYGNIYPLPRVATEDGLVFNGVPVPKGSVVSMSAWLNHRDPVWFPDADDFIPERWLDADAEAVRHREKLLIPFSKGARQCLGQPLAMAEIYVAIGTLFRRFGRRLKTYDVGVEDFFYLDYFIPFHRPTARKFRVVLED